MGAVDNFKQYLHLELDTFRDTVSRLAKSQSNRISEIGVHAQALLGRVRAECEAIHRDSRCSVQDAFEAFQKSVFKEYLEAKLGAFKETVSQFAKVRSDCIAEVGVNVQDLL